MNCKHYSSLESLVKKLLSLSLCVCVCVCVRARVRVALSDYLNV
jgi:hypothetical protein